MVTSSHQSQDTIREVGSSSGKGIIIISPFQAQTPPPRPQTGGSGTLRPLWPWVGPKGADPISFDDNIYRHAEDRGFGTRESHGSENIHGGRLGIL